MTHLLLALAAVALAFPARSAQRVIRLVALVLLLLLGDSCGAQMIWARRDPDMSSGATYVAGSRGPGYDASRGRHVLFQTDSTAIGSTRQRMFAFDGENWTTTTIANSSFSQGLTITEDPTGWGRIVRVAGYSASATDRWDPTTRSLTSLPIGPGLRGFSAFRFVPGIGAVLFGGHSSLGLADDHTWIWDGNAWSDVTNGPRPSPRVPVASTGGPSQPLLLFGGWITGSQLNDTWSFQGNTWTQLFPATVPPARGGQGMAYDPLRGRVVMYGGRMYGGSGTTDLRDTWEWDGVDWIARTPAHSPPAGEVVSMNWDPLRQRIVLAGITDGSLSLLPNLPIDTWEWDGTDWTQLNPNPTGAQIVVPFARASHVLTYDWARQRTVCYGGATGFSPDTRLNDVWEDENGLWQRRLPGLGFLPQIASQNAGAALRSNGTLCLVPGWVVPNTQANELYCWDGIRWSFRVIGSSTVVQQHQVLGSFFGTGIGWLLVRLITTPQWTTRFQVIDPSNGQVLLYSMRPGGPAPLVGSTMAQPTSPSIYPASMWLFGGFDGTRYNSDVWELSDPFGGLLTWNHLLPPSGQTPVGRRDAAVAYHDGLNRLFVMGGLSSAGVPLGDTWSFDLATRIWTPLGKGPSPRYLAAMTYDASLGRLVLFGGTDGTTMFDDVWEHDGVQWTRRTKTGRPSARKDPTLVYDRRNHRAVLFGGQDAVRTCDDTWSHDGTRWSPIVVGVVSPSPRVAHTACFVDQGGSMVLFGGSTGSGGVLRDTWRLDPLGQWSRGVFGPSVRFNAAMVYAIVQGRPACLLFGGFDNSNKLGDTWRYDPAADTWTPLSGGPPAREMHAMAWDRLRNVVVLFGGRASGFDDDTWEFDCATAAWSQRNPAHRPPGRWNATMDFDESRGRTVLFGGNSNGNFLNDIWEWDGNDWLQRTPETDGPPGLEGAAMAYDSDRGRMEVFGGWTGSSRASDLWFLSARIDRAGPGNTTQPEALRFHSQPALGRPLQLGFANPLGIGIYTIGLGPMQQPLAALPIPPMCEPSELWASTISTIVTGTTEPNISLTVPNSPTLAGSTLVFQAFALRTPNCWRATDALQVRL